MRTAPRTFWTLLAALTLHATGALAFVTPDAEHDGEIRLRGSGHSLARDAARQQALSRDPAWRRFESRHGAWRAIWNEATGSPHRAFGKGIPLAGYAPDAASVDRSVRRFVSQNADLFGAPELRTVSSVRVRDRWYVRYEQVIGGLPVRFTDWEFRVGMDGRLFGFGADAPRTPEVVRTTPVVVEAAAREAALAGLAFDRATDRVEGGALVLVPVTDARGQEYKVAYEFDVVTADPPGRWKTWVDAVDGEVLVRFNRVRHAISGTVTGLIHPHLPTDALSSRPFSNHSVTVGVPTVTTNASGFYTSSPGAPVTVTARIRGLYCDVNRSDATEASFSTGASDPSTVNIAWTLANSHDAERDGYYHVNLAHDYVKGLDPGLTTLDYVMPCAVNLAGTCNAYWNGFGVNFFAAGGGCPNIATLPDVVYHEYGHGVNDMVYQQAAAGYMTNGALHEGMADVFAAFLDDDPNIGDGFTGVGTILRTVDNTMRWPHDASGDTHVTGLIIAGAFWDLRQAIGLSTAADLSHFAKYGVPDDFDDGAAMADFFVETVLADDDDSDLSNGTPNFAAIVAAFNAHGIGTGFFIDITHTALADQPSSGGQYPVTATITYAGPVGSLAAASPTLVFALNEESFTNAPMASNGPNQYAAPISAPAASVVRYYVTAEDIYGGAVTHPATAPSSVHTLIVGPASTEFLHDQEISHGWVVGAPGDNATTGIWLRADPVGTSVQPEDDHTADPGVTCLITGNGSVGGGAGENDVDGGRTTLTTPAFDATGAGYFHPMIEYYRWYSNNNGSNPGEDFWRADISNNGGASWTPVEATQQSDPSWRRIVFRIEDFVAPTNNMKMRFIAEDAGLGGSLVEAGVDDFRLIGFPLTLDAPAGASARLALAAGPTPFSSRTTLRFALPAEGPVSLRVLDVSGRSVRALVAGVRGPGDHAVAWDGRGDGGAALPSGVYFARLEFGGRPVVQRLLRME